MRPAFFFVIGASGAGKTAAVRVLDARAVPGVRCHYFDSIGVPPAEIMERDFGSVDGWQAAATTRWVERLAVNEDAAEILVLDGQTRPSFVVPALERIGVRHAGIVLLDCDTRVRAGRLADARGQPELSTPRRRLDQRVELAGGAEQGRVSFVHRAIGIGRSGMRARMTLTRPPSTNMVPPQGKPVLQLRVALTGRDYEQLLRFYCVGLGVEPAQVWSNDGGRATLLDLGKATLELFDEAQAEAIDRIEVGRRVSGAVRFALEVPDLQAALHRLLAHGVVLVHPPILTPWGDRNARVQDPSGMQITLFQASVQPGAS